MTNNPFDNDIHGNLSSVGGEANRLAAPFWQGNPSVLDTWGRKLPDDDPETVRAFMLERLAGVSLQIAAATIQIQNLDPSELPKVQPEDLVRTEIAA